MANRQARNPGQLQEFNGRATIGSLPNPVVEQGDASRALAEVAGTLGARLKRMADGAASREGEVAGRNAGAKAGAKFIEQEAAEGRARARKGKTPAAPAEAGPDAPLQPSGLDTQPLQLRNDGSIRGEAFDAAAMKSYGWRMQTGLSTDLAAAFEANKDSPGGYEKAVGEISKKYLADGVMREGPLNELYQQLFTEKTGIHRLTVQANHERRVAAEQRAAVVEGVKAANLEFERAAYNAGSNPEAGKVLIAQADRAMRQIDSAVADGSLTRSEAAKEKKRLGSTVFAAQTEGTFDQLPNADAKQAFALSVMDDYAAGKGPFGDLSLDEAKSLSNELFRRATAEATRETAAQKAEAGKMESLIADDIASLTVTGQGLDHGATGLSADRVEQLLGKDAVSQWNAARESAAKTWTATNGMELETPAELEQRLAELQPKAGAEGFIDQAKIYEVAKKRAADVLKARETDPLLQAHGAGLIELAPIDPTTPDALGASLSARKGQAETVAAQYGTPLTIFRPEERRLLSDALLDHPEQLPTFAATLTKSLGPLAPQALSELSEEGPAIAHAAGIGMASNNNSVATDIGIVLAGRRDKRFTAKMPADGKLATGINEELAGSFLGNDAARSAVAQVAALLYEKDANQLGFDPGEFDKEGSAAASSLSRAVDRALGGQTLNGQHWGGLGTINGMPTVLPSFMPSDRPAELLGRLNDKALEALPEIGSVNGVPIGADRIRNANLVAIGDGQYRVALGDPAGLDPQFVATPDGDYWVLDFEALDAALAQPGAAVQRPSYWMMPGGGPK